MGAGPDRLPPTPEPLHGPQGPDPLRLPELKWTDPATGARTKTLTNAEKNRYTHPAPGDLVHIDIKKLGRIPRGGGWKKTAKAIGARNNKRERPGYAFLHHAVDDHSRLAYSEILTDERKETTAGFWLRAKAFFAAHGITVTAVLTDNGACYRSNLFAKTLAAAGIKHRRTRPYRPQTNGKVERFNRTLLEEWAYAETYTTEEARAAAYPAWLHHYNHHRGHTAHKGQPPIAFVPNVPGSNS